MIQLQALTVDNFWDMVKLHVDKKQRYNVWDNLFVIAQSKVSPECVPYGIYAEGRPVGMAMFGLDAKGECYWVYHLMIDQKEQGKGYGKEALEEILRQIKTDTSRHKIYLAVNRDNAAAIALYSSFGFTSTGELYGLFPGSSQIDAEFWKSQKEIDEIVMAADY
jgi:diamine N-acetyltransferase